MMKQLNLLKVPLLVTLFMGSLPPLSHGAGSAHPYQMPPDVDRKIIQALDELYNLNFQKGLNILKSLKPYEAEHPTIAFGVVSAHWWRLSTYVLETDPEESRDFLQAYKRCVKLAKATIKNGDPTGEGSLTLGGVYGLKGRWDATNRNWLKAYFRGRSAYKQLKRALKKNPGLTDAKMGLGIFDYYVATLPTVVRVLAFLGQTGDPTVGLQELHEAAARGIYARTPSKLFLVDIYARSELKPKKALAILEDLRADYPNSPFIQILHVMTLYNQADLKGLDALAKDYLHKVNKKIYREKFRTQALFSLGLAAFKVQDWPEALNYFQAAIATNNTLDAFHTWSYLYKGMTLDALGQRKAAREEYKLVLRKLRRWGSHDLAKRYLRSPFKGTKEDLKELEL